MEITKLSYKVFSKLEKLFANPFTIYVKSLCCAPPISTVLYVETASP